MLKRVLIGAAFLVGCAAPMVPDAGGGAGGGGGEEVITGGGMGGGDGLDAGAGGGGGGEQMDAGIDAGITGGANGGGSPFPTFDECAGAEFIAPGFDFSQRFTSEAGFRTHLAFIVPIVEPYGWVSLQAPVIEPMNPALSVYADYGATWVAAGDNSSLMQPTRGARLDLRLPSGQYCVRLEDSNQFLGLPPVPVDEFQRVKLFLPSSWDATLETEPNEEAATATFSAGFLLPDMTKHNSLLGVLSSDTDVDVFRVEIPAFVRTTHLELRLPLMSAPSGPGKTGFGSGLQRVAVKATRLDGTVLGQWLTTEASAATAPAFINVRVEPSTQALIFISRPAGSTPTANDFYQMSVNYNSLGAVEADDTANNTPATTQVLQTAGFAATSGTLTTGDVDHYALDLNAGDQVELRCSAFRFGSGLHAVWELLSPTLDVLQAETESDVVNTEWLRSGGSKPAVTALVSGRHVFRISAASQETANPSNHYRCQFNVVPAP